MLQHPFPALTKRPQLLHGGDYNPEQWMDYPEVWEQDLRLMKQAGVNVATVGVFSWAKLEPEEGRYDFAWLDRVMDNLARNGISAVLATPSGAKPNWMALKYPEIRRVNFEGRREHQGHRHNHCFTSPIYRAKVTEINTRLAERYKDHPALILWHISNEYNGECHCDLCKQAFRRWLQERYGSLEALNAAYWTTFWSHTYTAWEQIDYIDPSVHGLGLDWRRFVTHQTVDFLRHECVPLRRLTPHIPVVTNMMGTFPPLDYFKFAPALDVVSHDSYPAWHTEPLEHTAGQTAFIFDLYRSLKGGKPWLLMESTPSQVNWQGTSPLKRPGVHELTSLQAVAHGADSVMYFQWRKSRGSCEKFHGAVVDHVGHENTRVFREVAALGRTLSKLADVRGGVTDAAVALIFDWENRWALDLAKVPFNDRKDYEGTVRRDFYLPLWRGNVAVDILDMDQPLAGYKLVIAPMLYMVKPGFADRIKQFVAEGGTFVTTYCSGIVNETDLCFRHGFPGPLRDLLGLWVEETDALPAERTQIIRPQPGNDLGLAGDYQARDICDLLHPETAQTLATYASDFYADRPALTVNCFGRGRAYYIASRNDARFASDFLTGLRHMLDIQPPFAAPLPEGVSVQARRTNEQTYLFILNFTEQKQRVPLPDRPTYTDALTGQPAAGEVTLEPLGRVVLTTPRA